MDSHPFATALALATLAAALPCQGGSPRTFAAGVAPGAVELADLDGDGDLDLVVANRAAAELSLLAGDGRGGFSPAFAIPLPLPWPHQVAVADLDLDRRPDLVVGHRRGRAVTVLRSTGAGFAPAATFAAGISPDAVAVADLTGDGLPDVVAADSFGTEAWLLPGDGRGGLGAAQRIPLGSSPQAIVAADLDGDGLSDFATANLHTVSVRFGDGRGGFTAIADLWTAGIGEGITAGDIDGDGLLDLVVSDRTDSAVVIAGAGGRAFQPPLGYSVGNDPEGVVAGDLDGDGRVDIATADTGVQTGTVTLLLGRPGYFAAPIRLPAGGLGTHGLAVGDLDLDGRPDLVAGNEGSGNVAVFLNPLPQPFGALAYGTGTPGCHGRLGQAASDAPRLGNAAFALRTSNAPRNAVGLTAIGTGRQLAGIDPFGLGFLLHVQGSLAVVAARSDGAGVGRTNLPIPNRPLLAGGLLYTQSLWLDPCAPGIAGVVSSRGLELRLLP